MQRLGLCTVPLSNILDQQIKESIRRVVRKVENHQGVSWNQVEKGLQDGSNQLSSATTVRLSKIRKESYLSQSFFKGFIFK